MSAKWGIQNGHRWERINMITKWVVHMYINAEFKACSLICLQSSLWKGVVILNGQCGSLEGTELDNFPFGWCGGSVRTDF